MKVREIRYQYELDDATQFGADADLSNIDVCASYSAYANAVSTVLQRMYPQAQVMVTQGPHCIEVDGLRDHGAAPWIAGIIHDIWETFGWVRHRLRMTLTQGQIDRIFDDAETQDEQGLFLRPVTQNHR